MIERTDEELAADARMLAAELSKVRTALAHRGVEVDLITWCEGKIELTIERVTREKL